ncbi:MAG: RidA family protein [Planctomycetes bacterium]|nr:RidA family protein [Planctomycetota bacterium]
MASRDDRLEQLGYPLDRINPEAKMYAAVRLDGNVVYASGYVPFDGDRLTSKGKVPSEVSREEATAAAALCAANVLRAVRRSVGSLERIAYVIRITGYVNSDPDFTDQHLVMHGASQLVLDVFGEAGRHARTALGMAQLPLGSSVEVEMILRCKEDAP